MKKYFIHNIVASLLLSSSVLLAMELEVYLDKSAYTSKKGTAGFGGGVKEINPYLYIGQKEPGLYFVMERIDTAVPDSHLGFWKSYASEQSANHDTYRVEYLNGRVPKDKGFIKFQSRDHRLDEGLGAFETVLNEHNSGNELWVSYASTKEIANAEHVTLNDIEMVFAVMTSSDAPMVTHMGISRSFRYLLASARAENMSSIPSDNAFKIHPGLSMKLHSFAAKVMKTRDEKRLYMITCPAPEMRNIISNALGGYVYYRNQEEAIAKHTQMGTSDTVSVLRAQYLAVPKKQEELKEKLFDKYYNEREREIDELYKTMEKTPSPFEKIGKRIKIFDQEGKIVFEHDRDLQKIIVNNQKLEGSDADSYNWFYNAYMGRCPYVTVDLKALAEHLKLLEDK